ncbi:pif1 [Symbiodinium sp. CCMP2592]|nr:pif1 [Symbiodinium sp. CCMP2592]
MPFAQKLKSGTIDLCDESGTTGTVKGNIAKVPKHEHHRNDLMTELPPSTTSSSKKRVKAESVKKELSAKSVKRELPAESKKLEPSGRGFAFKELWAAHQGHGTCRGRPGQPCVFGQLSAAAGAAPSGHCDLCDKDMIVQLHKCLSMRLTHLLLGLDVGSANQAFQYVQEALGSDVAADYQARVQRARQRKDPARPRRGSRPRRTKEATEAIEPKPCSGREGHGCIFGVDGAALATTSDRCDICCNKTLKGMIEQAPEKMTKLLAALEPAALQKALEYIEKDFENSVAKDFESRVARAHRRRDPARPKRAPRGSYKKGKH